MAKQKIELSELITGYKFPVTNFKLDSARVAAYIEVVDDTNTIFLNSNVVPPMSVVALAMAELSNSISFPDGAIHVSQELTFTHPVNEGETITSHAEVSRIQKRGNMHLLTISLSLLKPNGIPAISGQTDFILPSQATETK